MCNNMMVALRTLIDLKFDRVLTSGGAANALDGAAMIDKMITEVSQF